MKYKTKQRQALLDYFSSVKGQHVTVGDVCAHFQAQGVPIGKTTVYRQVEALAEAGVLRKYVIDESSAACFAFEEEPPHCQALHCKCEQCGKLLHLSADTCLIAGNKKSAWELSSSILNLLAIATFITSILIMILTL